MAASPPLRRDLLVVLGFTLAASAPLLFKPFHIDEPFFLAIAGRILQDPLHPLDKLYATGGRLIPMRQACDTPLLFCYVLAAALKVSGGVEWLTRLLLLPFDGLSAAALYLIAARFLKRPLWPALVCLAAPGWLLNFSHLMGEKALCAFALWSLYALIRGVDDGDARWYWSAAAFCALATLSKYAGVFLLVPAVSYSLARRVPARRVAAWLALACAPVALTLLLDRAAGGSAAGVIWRETAGTSTLALRMWVHKSRALLCFAGGCGLVTAVWPLAIYPPRRSLLALSAATALLFLPPLDLAPVVRPLDRGTGWLLACGAGWGIWNLLSDRRGKGWPLWSSWFAGVALLLGLVYWSVLARLEIFLVPPLVFGMAERIEASWTPARAARFYRTSFALCLAVTAALGAVDFHFAAAQKDFADKIRNEYTSRGRRVWHATHWGLAYYLERAGAEYVDLGAEGWKAVAPGDAAVIARLSADASMPARQLANVTTVTVDEPIPLRLLSGWTGEAGFYSSAFGFLPFSISREPLEEFTIIEPVGSAAQLPIKPR
jgi:hypothetical protein